MLMRHYSILLLALNLVVVSCGELRGDQGAQAATEEEQDILIEFGNLDYLDENIQEMTQENTKLEGDAVERINEDEVDDEIASAEKQESYPVWKILLVVAGCAIGLALLVGAVVLVLKSRNYNVIDDEVKEKEEETTAISCLGKKLKAKEEIQVKEDIEDRKERPRITFVDHIRNSLAENIPV